MKQQNTVPSCDEQAFEQNSDCAVNACRLSFNMSCRLWYWICVWSLWREVYLSALTSVRRVGGGSSVLKRINHVCRLRCAKGVSVGFKMLLLVLKCCCRVVSVVVGFEISSSGSIFCCRVWSAMLRLRYVCWDPYIFLKHSKADCLSPEWFQTGCREVCRLRESDI